MSASVFDLSRFKEEPVLGIIRGITQNSLNGVMEAVISSEMRYVEITLNTPNALQLIETASKHYSDSLCIGAGTILSTGEARDAISAGAKFLVSPSLNEQVAEYCRQNKAAYFPGAYTPTEIEKAWNAGAAMVKVFPASQLGPSYFREIKGPFEDIHLMAVGGVNPGNVHDYFSSGASAVAVGGTIFSPLRMKNGEFQLIRQDLKEILLAVRKFFSTIC